MNMSFIYNTERFVLAFIIIMPVFSLVPNCIYAQNSQVQRQSINVHSPISSEENILYDEIGKKELPEVVMNSVHSSYPGHKLGMVYRGSDGTYKILLSMKNEYIAAFYDAGGEFIKLEAAKEDLEENVNDQWR
jgi:hypothetical protein